MEIPQELYGDEIIRYLPVKDILQLCKTSRTLSSICQDNSTWKYLIQRDFKVSYHGSDAKEEYNRLEKFWSMLFLTRIEEMETQIDPKLSFSEYSTVELATIATARLKIRIPLWRYDMERQILAYLKQHYPLPKSYYGRYPPGSIGQLMELR